MHNSYLEYIIISQIIKIFNLRRWLAENKIIININIRTILLYEKIEGNWMKNYIFYIYLYTEYMNCLCMHYEYMHCECMYCVFRVYKVISSQIN